MDKTARGNIGMALRPNYYPATDKKQSCKKCKFGVSGGDNGTVTCVKIHPDGNYADVDYTCAWWADKEL